MNKRRLIIVGLGMAAVRLLDELVAAGGQQAFDVVVFGQERTGGYNRIQLSHVLSGETTLADITSHDASWFERHGMVWHAGRQVVTVDTSGRCVTDSAGERHDYDLLVLATGSLPVRAQVPGSGLAGVMSFREVQDVERMLAMRADAGPVVVVGAGLLGLEAAYGLVKQGLSVVVVHRSDRIMSQQLDHEAASLLQRQLEALGMRFVLSAQVQEIEGQGAVQAVLLDQGERLAAQAVVMAMGIRPQVALARSAALLVNRGVLVDACCQTSVKGVYAIGECCEFDGHTYGLVAPIYRQVSVLVNQLLGDGRARFTNEETPTQLKVSGISLSAFGAPLGTAGGQSLIYRDLSQGIYRKVMLAPDGVVQGAVLLGDTRGSQGIFKRYQQASPLLLQERAAAVMGQLASAG